MNILLRTQYIVGAGLAYSGLALDPLMDMFKMLGRTAGHLQNVVGVSSKVIAGNDVRMLSYILHKGVIVAGCSKVTSIKAVTALPIRESLVMTV